jgi:RNA polymerase sigma-70 factor, ECF subfamily
MAFSTSSSLLQRLAQPAETGSWDRFVELYTPLLYSWTARMGLSDHDAADLVQDVFAILVEKLPTFRYDAEKSFRAWLKTVLLNRWRERLRRGKAAKEARGDSAFEEISAAADAPELEEEEYRRQLTQRALAIMKADFEPTTWKACWEFVVRDRPAAEVAAELGITVNAVYLAKLRILRRLREELCGLLS